MKKLIVIGAFLVCLVIILFSYKAKTEDGAVRFVTVDRGTYQALTRGSKVYVPYCEISRTEQGKQIGIVNWDIEHKVYEYINHSADEWIIVSYIEIPETSYIMREMSVTKIPKGLYSDDSWNKQ